MSTTTTVAGLADHVDGHLGTSAWQTIDQDTIDTFARITRDEQWIHVDPARAAEGPFGATIAHGLLTLSMTSRFVEETIAVTDAAAALNYGFERVRFPAPLPSGGRVRGHVRLEALTDVRGGTQATLRVTMESDRTEKPVCVADVLARYLRQES